MGRGFRRPIFLSSFDLSDSRERSIPDTLCVDPPVGSLKNETSKIPIAHDLHVDISPDPFLQQGKEGRILVDRHTTRCRAINRTLRDGSAGFGICAHAASAGIPDGRRGLSVDDPHRDLKSPLLNNI